MRGNILWLKLFVEEVVVERTRPLRKTWETRGRPALLIIGSYRMGFEIEAAGPRQRLRVFINYNHPASIVWGHARQIACRRLRPLVRHTDDR